MNPFQIAMRTAGARRSGRVGIYFMAASFGYRILRRVMSTKRHTLLSFEVKPGEVYEVRGARRAR